MLAIDAVRIAGHCLTQELISLVVVADSSAEREAPALQRETLADLKIMHSNHAEIRLKCACTRAKTRNI